MLGCVSRCGQSLEPESAEIDVVTISEPSIWCLEFCRARCQDGCAQRRQFASAGNEIGMEMGFGGEGDIESEPLSDAEIWRWIAAWIDHQRPAIPERENIRLVSQALVQYRHDCQSFGGDGRAHGISGLRPATRT